MQRHRYLSFVLLALILTLLLACQTEPKPEFLGHRTYLPAYPGSHWNYVDSAGQATTISTTKSYFYDRLDCSGEAVRVARITAYNGLPLWGYEQRRRGSAGGCQRLITLLKEDVPVGTSWSVKVDILAPTITHTIMAADTTVVIGANTYNSVIVVSQTMSPFSVPTRITYYAPNVGMIREDSYDPLQSRYDVRWLKSFLINN